MKLAETHSWFRPPSMWSVPSASRVYIARSRVMKRLQQVVETFSHGAFE